jgi:hypothetical protein
VKKIWLDLKRKNALGGLDAVPTHEYDKTVRDVVKRIRDLRFKVDQKLVQHNVDPLFPENYKTFAKWEFLIDSDVEFSKLKHLLDKNPKVLTEDPLVGLDYVKIIELIKKKRVLE